jgi:hypothetical protein
MRRRRLDKRAVRHSVKLLLRAEKVHRRNARLHRHNARLRSNAHQLRLGGKLRLRNGNQLRLGARLHPRRNERLRPHAGRVRHLLEKMLPSRIANLRGDDKGVRESLDNVVVVR